MDLGLPEKGYYERKDEKSVKLRGQYQAHVARTFELLGETRAAGGERCGNRAEAGDGSLPDFHSAMWSGAILPASTTR